VDYPEIAEGIFPRHRFMSAYEQKVATSTTIINYSNTPTPPPSPPPSPSPPPPTTITTTTHHHHPPPTTTTAVSSTTTPQVEPPDRKWQYLLFAAEPYETIAFKVPSREVDKSETRFWSHWNKETKEFFLQFSFKLSDPRGGSRPPPPAVAPAPPRPAPPPAALPPPPTPPGPAQANPPPPSAD